MRSIRYDAIYTDSNGTRVRQYGITHVQLLTLEALFHVHITRVY